MSRPTVVLMTGDGPRHRFVALRVAMMVELIGLVSERKRAAVADKPDRAPNDADVLAQHVAGWQATERKQFGKASFPTGVPRLDVATARINDPEVHAWVHAKAPDLVLLYGTGIVKMPLLGQYANRVLNMHLGLSPYYRGAATNVWPLVEGRPECVGATIHLATADVDAGGVLVQARPGIKLGDDVHDIGARAIRAGADCYGCAAIGFHAGTIKPRQQEGTVTRAYRRADFNADAVRRMWRNFEQGMVKEFLANREDRLAAYPIVQPEARC